MLVSASAGCRLVASHKEVRNSVTTIALKVPPTYTPGPIVKRLSSSIDGLCMCFHGRSRGAPASHRECQMQSTGAPSKAAGIMPSLQAALSCAQVNTRLRHDPSD